MDRVEAFSALFGDTADQTAVEAAVVALGDDPMPSSDEANVLDTDVLDRALDFAARPRFFADTMNQGPAKVLLSDYARHLERVKAQRTAAPVATATVAAAPTPQNSGIVADPLRSLLNPSITPSPARQSVGTAPGVLTSTNAAAATTPTRTAVQPPQGDEMSRNHPNGNQGHQNERRGQGQSNGQHQGQSGNASQGKNGQPQQPQNPQKNPQQKPQQNHPPPPRITPPSSAQITPECLRLIKTPAWKKSRADAEQIFYRMRRAEAPGHSTEDAADADAARQQLADWKRFTKNTAQSPMLPGERILAAEYLLQLFQALEDDLDLSQPALYDERFVTGQRPQVRPDAHQTKTQG